jgi:hypothetical protein
MEHSGGSPFDGKITQSFWTLDGSWRRSTRGFPIPKVMRICAQALQSMRADSAKRAQECTHDGRGRQCDNCYRWCHPW